MTILGIDTATFVTAVGVCREGKVLAERSVANVAGHAADLAGRVLEVLTQAGLGIPSLDGIAVSAGPGSFTGLRVGISFAKGISYATGIPVVAVPTLRALVRASDERGSVAACLDARRGEVYLAAYEVSTGIRETTAAVAIPPEEAVRRLREKGVEILLGDAADRYEKAFDLPGVRVLGLDRVPPRGGVVALEGEERLARGEGAETVTLVPFYARPSEPETRRQGASLTLEKTL